MEGFKYCVHEGNCVFRDKTSKRCRILEDTYDENCSFRKTKKQYVRELKQYPPLNKDIEYICARIVETGED